MGVLVAYRRHDRDGANMVVPGRVTDWTTWPRWLTYRDRLGSRPGWSVHEYKCWLSLAVSGLADLTQSDRESVVGHINWCRVSYKNKLNLNLLKNPVSVCWAQSVKTVNFYGISRVPHGDLVVTDPVQSTYSGFLLVREKKNSERQI